MSEMMTNEINNKTTPRHNLLGAIDDPSYEKLFAIENPHLRFYTEHSDTIILPYDRQAIQADIERLRVYKVYMNIYKKYLVNKPLA
ncbi:hypothetical protein E0485_14495 [Paenibacillus albiflavus]|uniref:Uncharacterized protein n=1 Tax=Paenibacillus albiflavus TaxID=2545760 RepID=A0A4V2WNQ6_9BACL|nr:hypothetical protein [Paenibacillus albiflavus]TCZ76402.1 hypothetical protein E0485_14495 [Paenibacillus albiflavus]